MFEECIFRYANRPIFSLMELEPSHTDCGISLLDDGGEMNRMVEPIFKRLIKEATSKNSSLYFAVGEGTYFKYQRLYCLVQCTPDISREQCRECLMEGYIYIIDCSDFSLLAGIYSGPNCHMRYNVTPFYNVSSSLPPMTSPGLLPHIRTSDGGQSWFSIGKLSFYILVFFYLL
ncbi:cysteine-rich receptor-like protein kinase 25 [Spinacia oleracea]|uniref:Cysteine-rich receptor-like protein kinase 25 n=1 Tax=Spinacia oleracea TaxID=3562 RepID=A0ABM3R5G2_SPIOL|nr:cysteine-rich receptor-like protein kinase 25 [Spinacia oleracea]